VASKTPSGMLSRHTRSAKVSLVRRLGHHHSCLVDRTYEREQRVQAPLELKEMHPTTKRPAATLNGNLASRQARRQVRHLFVASVGAVLLVPAYLLAQCMARQGWVTPLFSKTVLLCLLPYALAAQLLYRSIHVPAAEQRTLLLINTLLPYLLLVLTLALAQQPYSRGAVLMVTSLTLGWFWLAERWLQKHDKLQLLCLGAYSADELRRELAGQTHLLDEQVDLIEWPDQDAIPGL
jgi:cation transport ATPase